MPFSKKNRSSSKSKPKLREYENLEEKLIEWQQEYEMHMYNAQRTHEDAKDRAWYLPNQTRRDLYKKAWVSAGSAVPGPGLTGRFVAALVTFIVQYGLDCFDEYDYIEEKLGWCSFHLEKCAHYAYLIESNKPK